ncbi:MAG: hypothetical protein CO187_01945 [Zetaproteobacteria bacterium CG_4_9_14_3_um_filter_53_7]|nr:MAG: hypothetical protein CO187_01945 [Zetaproteobacteria bacterium CG_4_9_14_3_um_filter_53_7]
MLKPAKLYKYQSFSNQTIENLKSQIIFFSHPNKFNDPFDCSFVDIESSLSDDDYKQLYDHFFNLTDDNGREEMVDLFLDEKGSYTGFFKTETHRALNTMFNDPEMPLFYDRTINKGIACLTSKHDDILMWAHYADGHRGFCLEFDRSIVPFNSAKKVKYSKRRAHFDIVDAIVNKNAQTFVNLIFNKFKAWKYEAEWRMVHNESGDLPFIYEAKALTGVYFGSEMKHVHKEIICLILSGQNPDVKFFNGQRSGSLFEVSFQEVIYTPHIQLEE